MKIEEKINKLLKEATVDTTWMKDFQFKIDNAELEDFLFELLLRSMKDTKSGRKYFYENFERISQIKIKGNYDTETKRTVEDI